MAHQTMKTGYQQLTDRLNRFPQGAPPSEYLYKILSVLMSEREAQLVSLLPIKPFTLSTAAKALRLPPRETEKVLDDLASRALLLDLEQPDGSKVYTLPPPMAGFFEFSLMRTRGDIDQKLLSELFYQYLNVEEDFVRDLFVVGETKLGRIFVSEPAISGREDLHILDYERASSVIKQAKYRGVGTCYCRHKMQHLGQACDAPLEICLTLGGAADSLIRHGFARAITEVEAMQLLEQAYEHNLVQIGENEQAQLPFICNCCGCCCEALLAIKRFGTMQSINTTNYLPKTNQERCNGCGQCAVACPVAAIQIVQSSVAGQPVKMAVVDEQACLGCGICVRACKRDAMRLESRGSRIITPVNSVHRIIIMAIEKGQLHNLIFDNQAHFSHRAMAAVLGAILKLSPVHRLMASEQMKSKYLASLIRAVTSSEH